MPTVLLRPADRCPSATSRACARRSRPPRGREASRRAGRGCARRPRGGVVGRLEDPDPLHDRPVARGSSGCGRIAGTLRNPGGWLAGRSSPLPGWPSRLVRATTSPPPRRGSRRRPGFRRRRRRAAVRRGERRHLRQLQVAVLVGQLLARLLPRLAEVSALRQTLEPCHLPCGGEDRARVGVADHVVDRPALAERAAQRPVATGLVALEQEAAFCGFRPSDGPRHASPPM